MIPLGAGESGPVKTGTSADMVTKPPDCPSCLHSAEASRLATSARSPFVSTRGKYEPLAAASWIALRVPRRVAPQASAPPKRNAATVLIIGWCETKVSPGRRVAPAGKTKDVLIGVINPSNSLQCDPPKGGNQSRARIASVSLLLDFTVPSPLAWARSPIQTGARRASAPIYSLLRRRPSSSTARPAPTAICP